jgi:hypothetical protein
MIIGFPRGAPSAASMPHMSSMPQWKLPIGIAILLVGLISLGVIAGDTGIVVGSAIAVFSVAVLLFAFQYRFRRTHTPEERAALAAQSQLRRDRIKFARLATTYKRKVLRTGAEARAVITAVDDLQILTDDSRRLVYLELAVTVGADTPYAVRTGEDIGPVSVGFLRVVYWEVSSLRVGRELVVRVDPNNRKRVAVDWKQSTAPARLLQELETLRATGAISDAEYTAKREQIIADT